jgi:Ser/Thr protein kinase RdoA (MazF antagonist)
LDAYGLAKARLKFLRQAVNTLFRVFALNHASARAGNQPFKEVQYLLRIHDPAYQTADAIELELAWLAAMRQDAKLPVPEPVPTLDGRLLIQVSIPGIPGERTCSLLRWLRDGPLRKAFGLVTTGHRDG